MYLHTEKSPQQERVYITHISIDPTPKRDEGPLESVTTMVPPTLLQVSDFTGSMLAKWDTLP